MKKIVLVIFIAQIILNGCATFTVPRDYKIDENSDKGLVIVSFTQPYPVVKWMYRKMDADRGILGVSEDFISTTNRFNKLIRFSNVVIYPVQLPEGEYEFFRWTQPEFGYYVASSIPFSIRFKSVPGKVTYIGNIVLQLKGKYKQGYSLRVIDSRKRDLNLFLSNFRNIKEEQIEFDFMYYLGHEDETDSEYRELE